MMVVDLPRNTGKTTEIAKYMTQPGNEDVICLTPTESQAEMAWLTARRLDPSLKRARFESYWNFKRTPGSTRTRVVLDEADGVLSMAIGADVEMIALTGDR